MARHRVDDLDETRFMTLRLPAAMLEALDAYALELGASRADVVRGALATALGDRLVTAAGKLKR